MMSLIRSMVRINLLAKNYRKRKKKFMIDSVVPQTLKLLV